MKEHLKETFFQSIFALMTSQIIIKIMGLFYKLYITNKTGFGDEGNAIANSAFQIYALALSFTSIALPSAMSKIIAEYTSIGDHKNADRIFKVSLMIFSLIGAITSFGLICFSKFLAVKYLKIEEAETSIIVLAPSVFLSAITSVFKGYYAGREQIRKTAKSQTWEQFFKIISSIILIESYVYITKTICTENMAMLSNLAVTIGNVVELIIFLKEYKKMLPEINFEKENSVNQSKIKYFYIIKEIMKISIPITLTALISALSKNIDTLTIVNGLKNRVGYEIAKKEYGILSGKIDTLITLPLSLNMAITTALLPKIVSAGNNCKEIRRRIIQALKITLFLSIPIFLMYFLLSNNIIKILFPKAPGGGEILKISSFSIIFISIEQIAHVVLHGLGKSFQPIISITIGLFIKVILNYYLVIENLCNMGGARGIAVSTLACHIIVCVISMVQIIKKIKEKDEKRRIL